MKTQSVLNDNIYSELVIIYRQLEQELTQLNPGCDKCGTCCNFTTFDHVLYASSIEVGFITQHKEVPDRSNISNNICPFLKDNQCSIRDFRMLGCRVFYCNAHYQEISHDVYEKYYRMIRDLSIKYNVQWKYSPFLEQLAEFKSISSALANNLYPDPSPSVHS